MKSKILRKFMALLIIISFLADNIPVEASYPPLSRRQWDTADYIAEVAAENWDTYGVLPSVAVAQAFVESSLGVRCTQNNLWGIKSGAVTYPSLYSGVVGYMRVINYEYYKGAPFQHDYENQISIILAGGYCKPVGNYYSEAVGAIRSYGFDKYDRKMFKAIEKEKRRIQREKRRIRREKKRLKKQKKPFKIIYDNNIATGAAIVDKSLIKSGTVQVWYKKELQGIYYVKKGIKEKQVKGNRIRIGNYGWKNLEFLDKKKLRIKINEDAKG